MRSAKFFAVMLSAGMTLCAAAAEIKTQPAAPSTAKPIGRITAAFGAANIDNAGVTRAAELHSLINNDERITTDGGGISILLATRVVLKLDTHTAVRVFVGIGQTKVTIKH